MSKSGLGLSRPFYHYHQFIIVIIIIYLLHKAIERKKGKSTPTEHPYTFTLRE